MSRWSTGAVGPNHRAVMKDGIVLAVAESTGVASEIVRRMNEPFGPAFDRVGELSKDLTELRMRVREIIETCAQDSSAENPEDIEGRGWKRGLLYVAQELQEVLDGEPQ